MKKMANPAPPSSEKPPYPPSPPPKRLIREGVKIITKRKPEMTKKEAGDLIKINKKISMLVYLMVFQTRLKFNTQELPIGPEESDGFETTMKDILNELKEMDK